MNTTAEVIQPIPGYEAHYSVSSHGRVFSHDYRRSGKFQELAQSKLVDRRRNADTFYRRAKMWHIDRKSPTAIHRLVAIAFVPNPNMQPVVNHKDGDKGNNRADNLEWCSAAQNCHHAEATGLASHVAGEEHGMAILSEAQAAEIKKRLRSEPEYRGQLVDMGREYGVSKHCIFDIKRGRSWQCIP